jgi:electron transfer flavoprotein alpha subunit
MTILVIAEHDNTRIAHGVAATVTAAARLGRDIHVLVAGSKCIDAAQAASEIDGATRVLVADAPHFAGFTAENIAEVVLAIAEGYTHILAPATGFGKNFMPRVAARLDVAQISDITGIESEDTFVRPVYAGSAMVTVRSADRIKVITVRTTAFEAAPPADMPAPVENIPAGSDSGLVTFEGQEIAQSSRPDLAAARVVVSGGRGMGSGESFGMLERLADKLGGAVGASRAAVDAGYVPNNYQVGQTGKIVSPDLYIAVGISGAIQHLAGIKESKVIVAINKDADAPIFEIADYWLVDDLFKVVPEITAALDALGSTPDRSTAGTQTSIPPCRSQEALENR